MELKSASRVQLNLKFLPLVTQAIKQKKQTGRLLCQHHKELVELHFSQGNIIHATNKTDLQGDLALYTILAWPPPFETTSLEWLPGFVSEKPTIDEDEEKIWLEAVTDLQKRGYFQLEITSETKLGLEDFLAEKFSKIATSDQEGLFSLPPGQALLQLKRAVGRAEVKTYLRIFKESLFSGYIQCEPLPQTNTRPPFEQGLLIIEQGVLTYSLLHLGQGQPDLAGRESFECLRQSGFKAEAVEVATGIIEAWRGLFEGPPIYRQMVATSHNYQILRENFARSGRSGAVQLYYRELKLYTLIYQGQHLSIFRLETKTNQSQAHLQKMAEIPDFLLDNPDVKLDVFLTAPATPLDLGEETLSSEEVKLLDRSFQAVVRLVGEIATPKQISQHLHEVINTASRRHPLLGGLQIKDGIEPNFPYLVWQEKDNKIVSSPKDAVVRAYDYLFEAFLQKYCNPIGDTTFHAMAARAITPADAHKLNELGMHLDFLQDYPLEDCPDDSDFAPPEAKVLETLAHNDKVDEDNNPYEF